MTIETFCTLVQSMTCDQRAVEPESRLAEDLGLCSFDLMVLIAELQQRYDREVDFARLKREMTVQEFFESLR